MKNQKGITLVALVVTIVVLLILAGTSIAMLSGDTGILTNATKAKAANIEGEVTDAMKMAFNSAKMDDIAKSNTSTTYTRDIYPIANTISKELGGSGTAITSSKKNETVGKYKIECTTSDDTTKTGTIKLTYSDDTFKTGGKYNPIEMTVNVTATALTLDTYAMQTTN